MSSLAGASRKISGLKSLDQRKNGVRGVRVELSRYRWPFISQLKKCGMRVKLEASHLIVLAVHSLRP